MYKGDYDETNIMDRMGTTNAPAPGGPYASTYCGTNYWWGDFVQPYLKNTQIMICPNDSNGNYCVGFPNRSYQPNTQMVGVKDSVVIDPATTIHLIESNYNSRADYWDPGSYSMPGNPASRHSDGWNIAFADGHGKWMNSNDTYNGCRTIQLRFWTPAAD